MELIAVFAEVFGESWDFGSDVRLVTFIKDDDLFFTGEFVTEFCEFGIKFLEVADGVAISFAAFELRGDFDEVNEDSCAFEVF